MSREDYLFTNVKMVVMPGAEVPRYQTDGASCMDLHAHIPVTICIAPCTRKLINTGIKVQMPEGLEAQVRPRSGLTANAIDVPFGTIDSDYRGEIRVTVINNSKYMFEIKNGMRIAQLAFAKVERPHIVFNEALDESARGEGGFGSTGV